MRNVKRIPIVLNLINWEHFIKDHLPKDTKGIDVLIEKITDNIKDIEKKWTYYSDWRLGQLLINELYLPDHLNLFVVEETEWLVENNYCKFEEINFWISHYNEKGERLSAPISKRLIDLDDSHILAILDYFEDRHLNLPSDYKKYFENRLNIKKDVTQNN